MMTKPEVRAMLQRIRREIRALDAEIGFALDGLRNRSPIRRSPPVSQRMTDELRAEIIEYARAHPTVAYTEIGRHFAVNPGRVSETLAGHRRDAQAQKARSTT